MDVVIFVCCHFRQNWMVDDFRLVCGCEACKIEKDNALSFISGGGGGGGGAGTGRGGGNGGGTNDITSEL
ncbi:hypothetical protein BpHYR1_034227 [Brachionus plicatilis]|uniref:Uncharacterized protein n=1 Tax=Brachionus plicatilis TaxID=10195 RepID=A0A3M7R1I1_BRAPC|nr:hypothetical protein BpHYR1_034227 [Brachionus plicatilis]